MKKILILSPTPTHPPNAGNRMHINLLSRFLRQNNFDVYFFYIETEEYDKAEMSAFWKEKLHVFEKYKLSKRPKFAQYHYRRLIVKYQRIKRFLQYKSGIINEQQFKFNSEIDNYFPVQAQDEILLFHKKNKFDIVICEYAFISKFLDLFESSVYKILDTHDCFTDRFRIYLESDMQPEWITFYRSQERRALSRANLIIALQEEDKKFFQSITKRPVIRFFCIPEIKKLPKRTFEKKILYFASGNRINHKTLNYFETAILPQVKLQHPAVKILVGGSICNTYKKIDAATELLGFFEEAEDFYALGDVFINPEIKGTGFKIKTLEALCFGLPVVCTNAGAAGLLEPFTGHLLIADTANDFADTLNELLRNADLRENTSHEAHKWVVNTKQIISGNLLESLKSVKAEIEWNKE